MNKILTIILFLIFGGLVPNENIAQESGAFKSFFTPSKEYNSKRFKAAIGIGGATYAGFATGLYFAWYKQYPQESFHLFNDWNEWGNMDKMGHVYSSYFQAFLTYKGAKWTGLSENKSILTGIICGSLFQGTIEVMDGFSSNWGFSIPDISANTLGIGAFVLQQKQWGEQRIQFKVSAYPVEYGNELIYSESGNLSSSPNSRADALFGSSFAERFLKDYNAQIVWASFNIHSFLSEDSKVPKWLNIAVGYGANNMFGGFENRWEVDNDHFDLIQQYPRYKQVFLGLDIDLGKIKTDNYFLKMILSMLNIFKTPSPALEWNTQGEFKFHILR